MGNKIKALFTKNNTRVKTSPLWQYNYGQIMEIAGIDLPSAYEVHFTNDPNGTATTVIGNSDGVAIPDIYLRNGDVFAWLFLHTGEDDGETVYQIDIPVRKRAAISDQPPTPVQQDVITQAIAALNAAVEQTGQDVIDTNTAKVAAETAQGKAEDAQEAAETAQGKAENAQTAAETAQSFAEAAQTAAETAQGKAEDAQDAAEGYAANANLDANRAEQAANNAGYMEMEIVNGRLIYRKTELIDTDFELIDGHLIMEVAL